ncbi:MAG: hypothetical protein PVG12_05475 [Gammaproteobacteria bacterium]
MATPLMQLPFVHVSGKSLCHRDGYSRQILYGILTLLLFNYYFRILNVISGQVSPG